jgi:hypothetical protein
MRRNPDVQFGSYLRQVESEMLSRFGIGFSKIQQDVDPEEGPQLTSAAADGATPAGFVGEFARHYPLRGVSPGQDPAEAGRINRGIMALGTFARSSEDWVQGADGAAYRQDDGGVSRLVSAKDVKGSSFGFRAEHAEGAALDDMGSPPPDAGFEPVGGGVDIGLAVRSLDQALEARMPGPGLH